MTRPPLPPFDEATAITKIRMAEDGWNSRDPAKVALAYTEDTRAQVARSPQLRLRSNQRRTLVGTVHLAFAAQIVECPVHLGPDLGYDLGGFCRHVSRPRMKSKTRPRSKSEMSTRENLGYLCVFRFLT